MGFIVSRSSSISTAKCISVQENVAPMATTIIARPINSVFLFWGSYLNRSPRALRFCPGGRRLTHLPSPVARFGAPVPEVQVVIANPHVNAKIAFVKISRLCGTCAVRLRRVRTAIYLSLRINTFYWSFVAFISVLCIGCYSIVWMKVFNMYVCTMAVIKFVARMNNCVKFGEYSLRTFGHFYKRLFSQINIKRFILLKAKILKKNYIVNGNDTSLFHVVLISHFITVINVQWLTYPSVKIMSFNYSIYREALLQDYMEFRI